MITTAQFSAALLAVFEGLRLTAYRDTGNLLTIGIRHTGPDVTLGLTINYETALQLFSEDQAKLLDMVADKPVLEGSALASFGFNCGRSKLQKVLAGADQLENPIHTTDRSGNVRAGLVARRKLESMLIQLSQQFAAGA